MVFRDLNRKKIFKLQGENLLFHNLFSFFKKRENLALGKEGQFQKTILFNNLVAFIKVLKEKGFK